METIDKPNYEKMKKRAGDFAKMLIDYEIEFKQQINDCDDGLAVYFDIEARNDKKITFFFKDNGYVGIEVKDE